MFCGNCGKQIKDGSAFCGFCGARQITGAPSYQQPQPGQQFAQPQPNQMNYYRQPQPVSISGNDFKAIVDTLVDPFKDHSFGILPACVILVLTFLINIFRYCINNYGYSHPFVISVVVTLILLFGLFITVFIDHLDSMDVVKGLGKVAQILEVPILLWFISKLITLIGNYATFAYVLSNTLDLAAWIVMGVTAVKISRQKLPDIVFIGCIVIINLILRIFMTYGAR